MLHLVGALMLCVGWCVWAIGCVIWGAERWTCVVLVCVWCGLVRPVVTQCTDVRHGWHVVSVVSGWQGATQTQTRSLVVHLCLLSN